MKNAVRLTARRENQRPQSIIDDINGLRELPRIVDKAHPSALSNHVQNQAGPPYSAGLLILIC